MNAGVRQTTPCVDIQGCANHHHPVSRLNILLAATLLMSGCSGSDGPEQVPGVDSGVSEDAAPAQADAAIDSGLVEDSGVVPDSGEQLADTGELADAGMPPQFVDGAVSPAASCNDVCAAEALLCDGEHSWMFGVFVGGGRAEYGRGARVSVHPCDVVPDPTDGDLELTRWQCACR